MIADRSSPSRVRDAASRPGLLRADPGDVTVYEGKGMSRRPPAQISECARLIRASSSIASTGLMSVSPPATTRVYSRVAPRIVRIYTLRGFESPRLDHRALGQDRTVLRGVRERPDHRVCRTQASGRPWAEESLLPSDPRARPRLQDRVHPRLPEPAGALRTRIRRGLLKGEQLHVGETWRSGLSSTKPNFLRSTSSRPAHFSKQPG